MVKLYFDGLPSDVIIVMLSKIVIKSDMKSLGMSSYRVHRLLCDDKTYSMLFYLINTDLHDFIIKCNNVDGFISWEETFYFFAPGKIAAINEFRPEPKYLYNILYLYQISKEFPKIYEYVKDINLDHKLSNNDYRWNDVYIYCSIFKSHKFVMEDFTTDNLEILGRVSRDLLPDIILYKCLFKISQAIIHMIRCLKGVKISVRVIFIISFMNSDVYEKLLPYVVPMVVTSENKIILHKTALDCGIPVHYVDEFISNLEHYDCPDHT